MWAVEKVVEGVGVVDVGRFPVAAFGPVGIAGEAQMGEEVEARECGRGWMSLFCFRLCRSAALVVLVLLPLLERSPEARRKPDKRWSCGVALRVRFSS